MKDVLDAIADLIKRSHEPLIDRIRALEGAASLRAEDLEKAAGSWGKMKESVEAIAQDVKKVQAQADATIAKAAALELTLPEVVKGYVDAIEIPKPKDGVTLEDIRPAIDRAVDESIKTAVQAIKTPEPIKGDKGEDGPTMEQLEGRIQKIFDAVVWPAPVPGRDGLDAVELHIEPSVSPQRRYQYGTYAQHDGGLVKAARDTTPLHEEPDLSKAGWSVVVQGVSSVEAELDGRELSIKTRMTGGQEFVKKSKVPVMIHRGVWREGDFEPGDVVTLGGSEWHAKANTRAKPGTSDHWLLVVKCGRDGKDVSK